MEKSLFDRLLSSAKEMVAIEKGEKLPPIEHYYEGRVHVWTKKNGVMVWHKDWIKSK